MEDQLATSSGVDSRPEKRPRAVTTVENLEFQFHSLRISASRLAALVGFNPFANVPELICELVYQGTTGQRILKREADLLGLDLVSEEEMMKQLAARAGDATLKAVQLLDAQKPQSIQQASNIKKAALENASNLGEKDLKRLKEHIRSKVDTNYGTFHENAALDAFEKMIGSNVTHRNEHVRAWDFECHENTVRPVGSAKVIKVFPRERSEPPNGDDDDEVLIKKSDSEPPSVCFFSIVGSIDGMHEELASFHAENEKPGGSAEIEDDLFGTGFTFRPIVLECKHRLRRIAEVPPLYEQIQAIAYCFMYETDHADILQVLRKATKISNKSTAVADPELSSETKRGTPETATPQMSVYRVSLDDATMQHRQQWRAVILPRIRDVVQAVYDIRRNDELRYHLLTALSQSENSSQSWLLLYELCPWLEACDSVHDRSNPSMIYDVKQTATNKSSDNDPVRVRE